MLSARCPVYLSVCLQILNSFNSSGMDEQRSLNLANGSSTAGFTPGGEKFSLKGAWSGSREPFKILNFLQYFWNGRSYALNLASGLTTASSNLRVKIPPERGKVWVT